MSIKRMAAIAALTAIALTIFMLEAQIPVVLAVPGIKLGLANIVTLAASLVFFVMDIADRIVPVVFLAVYAAAVFFFPDFFRVSLFAPGGSGDVLFAIFSGGLFFTAFYLLSDVATLPRTKPGRVILGVFAGAAAFFTCGLGGDTLLGAVCTVFLANMLSPAIEYIENRLLKAAPVETVLYDR